MKNDAFNIPEVKLGRYRHYSGKEYEILGVGCHSETLEYFVIYKPLYEHIGKPDIWIRPYNMFIGSVELEGKSIQRFSRVDD